MPWLSPFKGIYELRKPQAKYSCIWDVSKVLSYLRTLHPPHALPLKSLTLKLVMLLLLVTGQREQAKYSLSLDVMTVYTTSCQFQLLDHTKTTKPGQKCKPVVIHEYRPDPKLCPLSMLKEYIKKTKPLRNTEKQLLISFIRPHKDVLKLSAYIDITPSPNIVLEQQQPQRPMQGWVTWRDPKYHCLGICTDIQQVL